jgi:hypothetical protein
MLNYALQYCREVLGLDVQFCEKDEGLTDVSLANFKRFLPRIGSIASVYLIYPPEGFSWGFWTVLVNRDSEAFIFSGFAWGYCGSGPIPFRCPRMSRVSGPSTPTGTSASWSRQSGIQAQAWVPLHLLITVPSRAQSGIGSCPPVMGGWRGIRFTTKGIGSLSNRVRFWTYRPVLALRMPPIDCIGKQ